MRSALAAALDGRYQVAHAWLTFGGTWGVPGTGYCSWVVQQAMAQGANVYEVPVQGPYSFGPIPAVSQSQGITGPSYRESIDIAVEWAVAWLLAHPLQTFGLAGYSMGGEAASRVLWEIINPGGRLNHLRGNYIGGFTFGNPSREKHHTYPGGIDPGGCGISGFNLVGTPENWHDHANGTANGAMGDDLYTTKHDGQVGQDEQDVYDLATQLQLHDFVGFVTGMIQAATKMVGDLGGLPYLVTAIGTGSIFTSAIKGLITGLFPSAGGILGGGGVLATPNDRIEAAVEAAMVGIKFLACNPPTGPHVTYEFSEAAPGVTHLQHAANHVVECAATTTARMAA